ncbi:ATPases with chaperone activity, ATP-binding subunit, partial [Ochromonadaceae sp. CCMP2298]
FSPEFVNRLDDILVFNSLTSEAMARICRIQLRRVAELLRGRGVELVASEGALRLLALQGTDLRYGARPMKRLVQSALLNPLATLMLQERVAEGHTVVVT